MVNSRMTHCVSELIGPNVKFHHSKINSKLPGSRTEAKWHQDFLFTPHSNDDVITALLMLDDVTQENGPLEVVPGTHRGKLYELWHGGVFTGTVEDEVEAEFKSNARICCGSAGSACLMHTRLLHGREQTILILQEHCLSVFILLRMPFLVLPIRCLRNMRGFWYVEKERGRYVWSLWSLNFLKNWPQLLFLISKKNTERPSFPPVRTILIDLPPLSGPG